MSTKILFTGGRAPATLDMARQFKAAGYELYVAESESHHICRRSNVFAGKFIVPKPNDSSEMFAKSIVNICKHHQIQLVIPTCEELFHLADYKSLFDANQIILFTANLSSLNLLHNKYRFIQFAKSLGFAIPETKLVTSESDLTQTVAQLTTKVVLKPVFSRFSANVYFIQPGEAAPATTPSHTYPWVVQTFIKGTQYCSYSVARDGELVAHACYPTRFSAGIGATLHFQPVEHPGIQQFVQAVAKELRFTGQLSFDFIVREDHSFFPIECNPRTTSGVHLFKGQGAFPHVFLQTPAALITPLPTIERQLALPMFLYSFRKKGFWPAFRKAKDVIWDRRDPWPAFDQWLIYSVFIWRTWWTGKSILALTTSDIEWAGEK